MSEWQPIETAPKDGTYIIAYFPSHGRREAYAESAYFVDLELEDDPGRGVWVWSQDGDEPQVQPTHWMPLPEAPK